MKFKKYISAGNDFLIFKKEDLDLESYGDFARSICNRHFGVGADGILIVSSSDSADVKMTYINSDGSEGEMCGNGIMSFGKYVYESSLVKNNIISVETKSGLKFLQLEVDGLRVRRIRVSMGRPGFRSEEVPVKLDLDKVIAENIEVDGYEYLYSAVNMGVPHVVIFVEKITSAQIDYLGGKIENHPLFPEKTNVNFARILEDNEIDIFTWERGAGRTLGCGTGSSSAVVIGNEMGRLKDRVKVNTEGGVLFVEYLDGEVFLIGQPEFVFEGSFKIL